VSGTEREKPMFVSTYVFPVRLPSKTGGVDMCGLGAGGEVGAWTVSISGAEIIPGSIWGSGALSGSAISVVSG